jgi:hypothetical protein
MAHHKFTEAERAERRQADRDRLEQAARSLLTSEGWQRWVRVRSRNGLARYSFGNQLLIATQRPDATYVAGFRAFLELNRCVRKGERAIRILAPMGIRDRDRDAHEGQAKRESEQPARTVFRAVPVFDVSQTDPLPDKEPVPLEAPRQPIQGATHAHLLTPLEQLAAELGYTVHRRPIDGSADGWCDSRKHEIVINDKLPANAQVRILVHESIHALGVDYQHYSRAQAEVIVDTVIFSSCQVEQLGAAGFRFGNSCHRRRSSGVRFARTRPVLSSRSRTTHEVGSGCLSARCGSGRLIVAPCGCVFDGAGSHRAGPES